MKISIAFILFTLLALLIPNQSDAQYIIKKGRKYMIDNEKFAKEDLGRIFENSPQAMRYYQKGMSKGKIAKNLFKIGTTSIGASILIIGLIASGDNSNSGSISEGVILGVVSSAFLLSAGVILDLISIPFYAVCSSNLNSAVNHYNWEIDQNVKQEVGSLNLSITNSGVGIVYSF